MPKKHRLNPLHCIPTSILKTPFFFDVAGQPVRKVPKHLELSPSLTHIFGIGHSGKGARMFFSLLEHARVHVLVDIRRVPQYPRALFANGPDLAFFCERFGMRYVHVLELAPEQAQREIYAEACDRAKAIKGKEEKRAAQEEAWVNYSDAYLQMLMDTKALSASPVTALFTGNDARIAFLCSEHQPNACHRRLLMEMIWFYLSSDDRARIVFEHLIELKPQEPTMP